MEVPMVSLILTALAAAAMPAAEDMACMPLQVTTSTPAANATNVPIDATFAFVFEGNCGGSDAWTLEIVDADGGIVATSSWTWDGTLPALARLDPVEDLPPSTALVLRATGTAYSYNLVEIPFTTGTGTLQPLTGALAAEVTEATWFRASQSASVSVIVDAAVDPNGLSLIRITGGEGSAIVYIDAEDAPVVEPGLSWFDEQEPAELCVEVVQIDGSGAESAPVEACAPATIERGDDGSNGGRGGCFGGNSTTVSTDPAEPVSAMLLFGGLFLLRRRNRR